MSLVVAMLLTLAISTFVPAIGPADALGFKPETAPIVRALHESPAAQVLQYAGIVSFPSFHTVMAVQFAYAYRSLRLVFPTAIGLNALMIVSVPYAGDHYFIDVLAGAVIAIAGIAVARWIMQIQRLVRPPEVATTF